jgi:hypothetical protein
MEILGTIIAIIVATITLWSAFSGWKSAKISENSANIAKKSLEKQMESIALSSYVSVEQTIKNNSNLLRFHGVTKKDLEEANIDEKDFSYLLSNFTAGGIYYRNSTTKDKKFLYYENMFQQDSTRKAWYLIKRCMAPIDYVLALNMLYEKHK